MTAAALAKKARLTVSIVNGSKLKEVANALDNKAFQGSLIAS